MDGPRINSDERGFTINKTLFTVFAIPTLIAMIWVGSQMQGVQELRSAQIVDRAAITANSAQINGLLRTSERVDQRLLGIEQSQARQETATNEILRYLRNPESIQVPAP